MSVDGKRVALFLQARVESSRLDRKMLLRVRGKTVLEHAVERLALAKTPDIFQVLTTPGSMETFGKLETKIPLVPGSDDDVLSRYTDALEKEKPDIVVRACGENLFQSPEYIDRAVSHLAKKSADYTVCDGLPYGGAVEVLSAKAVRWLKENAAEKRDREHVTILIREHPERFERDGLVISKFPAEGVYHHPELRLTLDTPDDLSLFRRLFRDLYGGSPIPLAAAINYILCHPEIALYSKQAPT